MGASPLASASTKPWKAGTAELEAEPPPLDTAQEEKLALGVTRRTPRGSEPLTASIPAGSTLFSCFLPALGKTAGSFGLPDAETELLL